MAQRNELEKAEAVEGIILALARLVQDPAAREELAAIRVLVAELHPEPGTGGNAFPVRE